MKLDCDLGLIEFETLNDKSDGIPDFRPRNPESIKPLHLDSDSIPDFQGTLHEMDQGKIPCELNTSIEAIKGDSNFPDEINENIGSVEELEIYKDANLEADEVGERPALKRNDIDPKLVDEDGVSNLERMKSGKPPIDKDGNPIELHHIGQKSDSPLAELTRDTHRGKGNDGVLHDKTKESEINRNDFAAEKRDYWKERAKDFKGEI